MLATDPVLARQAHDFPVILHVGQSRPDVLFGWSVLLRQSSLAHHGVILAEMENQPAPMRNCRHRLVLFGALGEIGIREGDRHGAFSHGRGDPLDRPVADVTGDEHSRLA